MPTLSVEFTEEQYSRFKAAFKKLRGMEIDPPDEQLIAALKREAVAITCVGEDQVGKIENVEWKF